MFRQYGDAPDGSGRKIACFFGNSAVPEGHGFTDEHLHAFCDLSGLPEPLREQLEVMEALLGVKFLAVDQKAPQPVDQSYLRGATVNHILTADIWRC